MNICLEDHPAFEKSDHYEEFFGINDAVVVAVENEKGIFNQDTLKQIVEITHKIGSLEEINQKDVRSLATADNIEGSVMGIEVNPFFTGIPDTEEKLNRLKQKVNNNKMV